MHAEQLLDMTGWSFDAAIAKYHKLKKDETYRLLLQTDDTETDPSQAASGNYFFT